MTPVYLGTRKVLRFGRVKTEASTSTASSTAFTINVEGDMNVAYRAQPFVKGPSKATTNLGGMDSAYCGQPFVIYGKRVIMGA